MAGRGPKKTDLRILKMRGSWLARKRTEPKKETPSGSPEKKIELDGEALKCFDEVVSVLGASLGAADSWAIAQYAKLWAEWVALLEQDADETFTKRLNLQKHMLALSDRLGLTALSRARLASAPQKKEHVGKETKDKAKFFAG